MSSTEYKIKTENITSNSEETSSISNISYEIEMPIIMVYLEIELWPKLRSWKTIINSPLTLNMLIDT